MKILTQPNQTEIKQTKSELDQLKFMRFLRFKQNKLQLLIIGTSQWQPSEHRGERPEHPTTAIRCCYVRLQWFKNKYGTAQEVRSNYSHTKSINIDFSLVLFVSSYVDL